MDAVASTNFREKARYIQGISKLAAIFTEPESPGEVACIYLNAGILHRIGSGRLHVKLARELASHGMLGVRLDHSSIGDSGARRGSMEFVEAGIQEVKDTMDFVQNQFGIKQFLLFGLCSGADVGFETAVDDSRVVGIVQLDAWKYPTYKTKLLHYKEHYGPQLADASAWLRFIRNRIGSVRKMFTPTPQLEEWFSEPDYIRETPPKAHVRSGLQKLVDRGAKIYIAFTGARVYGLYKYEDQYREAFSDIEFGDTLKVKHFRDTTHLFTDLDHQLLLQEELVSWMYSHGFLAVSSIPSGDSRAQSVKA